MKKHYKMGAKYQGVYGMLELIGTEEQYNEFCDEMTKKGYKIVSTFEENID